MSCVWDLRAATPIEVANHLRNKGLEVPTKTAAISLARLEAKGYLRATPGPASSRGRPAHVYFALVTHQDALRRQFQKFLDDHSIDEEGFALLETFLGQSMTKSTEEGSAPQAGTRSRRSSGSSA